MLFKAGKGIVYFNNTLFFFNEMYNNMKNRINHLRTIILSKNRDYLSENRPLNFNDIFQNYGETFGILPASL